MSDECCWYCGSTWMCESTCQRVVDEKAAQAKRDDANAKQRARIEAKRLRVAGLESAIASAGFRVAPDYHGAPTLWCIECGRDSGMHWAPCSKVKRDIERANDTLVAQIADAMLDFEEGTAGVYVRQRWGADKA